MSIDLTWAGVGVIIAISVHAFYTVRWASKVEFKLSSIADSFLKLDKELEKRDVQINAAWKRIDNINERIIKIESVYYNHHKKEE